MKKISFGLQARRFLGQGLNQLAKAVKITLGPSGRNAIIQKEFGLPQITKDGVTVASEIELKKNYHNAGILMIRESSIRTNDDAGDGTTTATVLTQAIYNEGLKLVEAGYDPLELKRGIDYATDVVVEKIKEHARRVKDISDIESIGTISANGDKEVGRVVASAIESAGVGGVITIEQSKTGTTDIKIVKGLTINRGYLSEHFANQDSFCVFENPNILVTDKQLNNIDDIIAILSKGLDNGKGLVIFAPEFSGEGISTIMVNRMKRKIKVCAIREHNKEMLEDIANITGADFITNETGYSFKAVKFGSCDKITVNRINTVILNGAGDKELLKQKSNHFKEHSNTTRQGRYDGSIVTICVGGQTEPEMKEKKDRYEDVLNATRSAIEEGVVAGGGALFAHIAKHIESVPTKSEEFNMGVLIIKNAITVPLKQISQNAGLCGDVVLDKVSSNDSFSYGFNARTKTYEDLLLSRVIDPAKVVRTSIQNAASVAGTMITTEVVISEES